MRRWWLIVLMVEFEFLIQKSLFVEVTNSNSNKINNYCSSFSAKCTTPVLSRYVEIDIAKYPNDTTEDSIILFRCAEGFTPNVTIISTCTREGKWRPDPFMHHCEPLKSRGMSFIMIAVRYLMMLM